MMNHILTDILFKLLGPEYMCPEEMKAPFSAKVIVRDKRKHGGHDFFERK